jgi:manganese-dependent inorganic pyrophosphatase
VDGADHVPISEIIDHHRTGARPMESPTFSTGPWLTSTIGDAFQQNGIPIPKNIAGLLMRE